MTESKQDTPLSQPGLSDPVGGPALPSLSYGAYQKLIDRAVEAFGSEIAANHWLNTPQPRWNNQIPMKIAEANGFSLDLFEEYFVRIEHGIYS